MRISVCRAGLALAALLAAPRPELRAQAPQAPPAQTPPAAVLGSLDAFMETVLARREINRKTLNQYVLDETESFEILGPGRSPLYRTRRDFTWYVREGMHVRSPLRFDGVSIGADARDEYERNWVKAEQDRRKREAERAEKNEKASKQITISGSGIHTNVVPTEPRFVSESYFMDFKFEAGNYYLAGREKLEGIDVLRIEYYPTNLFRDDDDKAKTEDDNAAKQKPKDAGKKKDPKREQRKKELEQDIDRKMNKTALITLWVDPVERQIVKYTFDNVWMDFLPGAWLIRVDELRASMTMGQPFPGVWLPRGMNIHAGITLANGSYEAGYTRNFAEYREAEVTTKVRIPKDGGQ